MGEAKSRNIFLIMAGGSGTRFWPASRADLPKQYLTLFGNKALITQTAERILSLTSWKDVYVSSVKSQKTLLETHLPQAGHLILEPEARNTAPCLMLATADMIRHGHALDTVVTVLPADHYIGDEGKFRKTLSQAIDAARSSDQIITMGIHPTHPHTGYGYIETDPASKNGVHRVIRFVEKPDLATAESYLKTQRFYWNSGIFIWKLSTMVHAFERYMGEEWRALSGATTDQIDRVYSKLKSQPIDKAIMEKTGKLGMMVGDFGWSDVGSWNALYDLLKSSPQENLTLSGETIAKSASSCLVKVSPQSTVVLLGVKDLVVVESGGTLLIMDRHRDQDLRDVVKDFEGK